MVGSLRALEEAVAGVEAHVVLRYGTFYGPGTWHARGGALDAVLRGRATDDPGAALVGGAVPGDAVSSFVHVEDAALAAVAALGWPSGAVNVVDDEPAPAREWLPAFAAAVGAPAPAPVEGPGAGREGWERGADNTRARRLGWRPVHASWRTGFTTL